MICLRIHSVILATALAAGLTAGAQSSVVTWDTQKDTLSHLQNLESKTITASGATVTIGIDTTFSGAVTAVYLNVMNTSSTPLSIQPGDVHLFLLKGKKETEVQMLDAAHLQKVLVGDQPFMSVPDVGRSTVYSQTYAPATPDPDHSGSVLGHLMNEEEQDQTVQNEHAAAQNDFAKQYAVSGQIMTSLLLLREVKPSIAQPGKNVGGALYFAKQKKKTHLDVQVEVNGTTYSFPMP